MIDVLQLILVEPDSKRLGWGVVRFVGFLQVCQFYFLDERKIPCMLSLLAVMHYLLKLNFCRTTDRLLVK